MNKKTFIITSNYEYEIEAENSEEAIEKWHETIEEELALSNECVANRFLDSLVAEEVEQKGGSDE